MRTTTRRATPEERKVIFRDVLIFQLKLGLDGIKDIFLSPIAIVAAGADVLFPTDRVGKRFYHVLRLGEKFDRWLSLFAAAERADPGEGGLFGSSRAGSASMLGKLEEMVLGQEPDPAAEWDAALRATPREAISAETIRSGTEERKMSYPYKLPDLPYAFDALEPHIDAKTMEIHHDKHHAAYTNNLNAALEKHPEIQGTRIEELLRNIETVPEDIRGAVRNNGGGYVNHTLFWEIMGPGGGGEPSGALLDAIKSTFGSFADFKTKIQTTGVGQFGSGWAWLAKTPEGKLEIYGTPNQDTPIMKGHTPILGVDVWEHAYYLNYQNRRPDYLAAWWNTVNWENVAARFNG
jgi:superoxide dismutase, Fe-Mn family